MGSTFLCLVMTSVQIVYIFLLAEESSLQLPLLSVCTQQGTLWLDQRLQLTDPLCTKQRIVKNSEL